MKLKVTVRGFKAIDAKFARLIRRAPDIATAAVSEGLGVLAAAAEAASPGRIGREVGIEIHRDGARVWGRAGLMQMPQPGSGPGGPYGIFPDQGTRYQRPQNFIGRAMSAALPRAIQAAKNAANRTATRISEKR